MLVYFMDSLVSEWMLGFVKYLVINRGGLFCSVTVSALYAVPFVKSLLRDSKESMLLLEVSLDSKKH